MQNLSRIDDPTWHPKAAENMETNEVADGYIVYQPGRDRVHYLNQTAAILLALCNGKNCVADLPELLRLAFDLATPPATEVQDCLELLVKEGLIT
jgi:Coenzyme PQQ synthesis protein D (PqqD)